MRQIKLGGRAGRACSLGCFMPPSLPVPTPYPAPKLRAWPLKPLEPGSGSPWQVWSHWEGWQCLHLEQAASTSLGLSGKQNSAKSNFRKDENHLSKRSRARAGAEREVAFPQGWVRWTGWARSSTSWAHAAAGQWQHGRGQPVALQGKDGALRALGHRWKGSWGQGLGVDPITAPSSGRQP